MGGIECIEQLEGVTYFLDILIVLIKYRRLIMGTDQDEIKQGSTNKLL